MCRTLPTNQLKNIFISTYLLIMIIICKDYYIYYKKIENQIEMNPVD